MIIRSAVLFAVMTQASFVFAQEVRTDDSYGDAFLHYQPYTVKTPKPPEKKAEPAKPAPAPAPKTEQKVDVKWLQENYRKLEEQAIDNPTDDNVAAYLYVKRITMDKSQRFSDKVMEVTNHDPLLNENNRIPYASSGAQSIRSASRLAQEQAVRELAAQGGLVIFVDGTCRFCVMQMPVIKALKQNYGVETLVVSLDGARPKGYAGPVVKDNGLYHKLELKLTPSIVYVHKPKGYRTGKDNNVYRIVAQGFYAQDELVKQIAFAGHNTNILSANTMRDLDVWRRGVASTDDMNTLALDPQNVRAIREKLQPILQKQY
jgi:conjugal transfer pilus assembly protein TraF